MSKKHRDRQTHTVRQSDRQTDGKVTDVEYDKNHHTDAEWRVSFIRIVRHLQQHNKVRLYYYYIIYYIIYYIYYIIYYIYILYYALKLSLIQRI